MTLMGAVVAATSPACPALRYRDGAAALSPNQPDGARTARVQP